MDLLVVKIDGDIGGSEVHRVVVLICVVRNSGGG